MAACLCDSRLPFVATPFLDSFGKSFLKMFEVFANYLRVNGGLTDEDLKLVEAVTLPKRIRKRQYLLQEGDVSRYNTFITKGCLRLYRVGNDGAEHILRFAVEDWWISDYESYHSGLPSKFNIDALEDSELLLIEKEKFDALCETIPRFRKLREKLDNKNFEVTQNRIPKRNTIISSTCARIYTTAFRCICSLLFWVYPAKL
jgi:CRP-like cAMP-binding protein